FGIAIGVLISFVGGLMAIDLVPRKATGAALGIVGLASYMGAGIQDIVSGVLIDGHSVLNEAGERVYDFTPVSWFWIIAAAISFMLPILNWRRKQQQI
ncbi:MAG: MFS transporter, partial [Bacteroidales bacterium]|nr:MFS transporter [Bacteroidales bacterium]